MLYQILTVVAPVFVIIGIGVIWARMSQPFDNDTVGGLVLMIGTPCLIFSTLTSAEVPLEYVWTMGLATVSMIAVAAVVGWVVLRIAGLPVHTYLLSAMHGNSANMGLALVAMLFAAEGLALGIVCLVVVAVSQNTLGLVVSAGRFNPGTLIRQPIVLGMAATLGVMIADVPVPEWVARTTALLGGIVIPTMLILLGVALTKLRVGDIRIASAIAVLRLVAGGAGAVVVIWAFGLEGEAAGVILVMALMPAAVINFLYAERFDRSPERVAGVIVVSTAGTLAILPGIVWLALMVAG